MSNLLDEKKNKEFCDSECDDSCSDSESETEIQRFEEADDVIIELEEQFDQHKLNHILQNKKIFKKQMRKSCFEDGHNPFAVMEKYLELSRKGKIRVKYKQNNGVGRFFAVGGLSMQSLPREIRHTIGQDYVDIDVVNAHPVILSHLCKQRKITCKYLDLYINNRDELLSQLKVDRETGKTAVLSFMNGGSKAYNDLEYQPKWIKKMRKEMIKIHNHFATDNAYEIHKQKREAKGLKSNHKGSYMNVLLCDFENKILQEMYNYFGKPNNAVLCFDGIMLLKEEQVYDLPECEAHVFEKLDIKIKLKMKPMADSFTIDEKDIKKHNDKEWFFHHMRDFVNQAPHINKEKVIEWMRDTCIVAINRGRSMLFTKNLEIDGSIMYEPQESLTLPEFAWEVKNEKGKTIKMSFNNIFQRHVKWQYSYDYFNFIPYLTEAQKENIHPRLFNTFSGFRWKYTEKKYELDENGIPIPPDSIKPWINHVKHTLCKDGQGPNNLGHTIIQWYAHIFQNPTVKPWALVFMSEEGLGKGLWQTFFENVLTKSLTGVFTSWDQITGSFNGKMAGKLHFTLNEATNYPTNTQKELMKSMIKDTQLQVNKKFVNQYDIDNYARIQITTNNRRPVSIDYDDRRYCCIESDNSKRGNEEYFKPLIESRFDEKTQHDMFDYLTNYPLEGFNSEKPPMTKWKRELIGQNLNSTMEFIKTIYDNEVLNYKFDEDNDIIKIKAKDLYDSYVMWCNESGEHKSGSSRNFYAELKKNGIIKGTIREEGNTFKGFKLVKSELETILNKLLCK